MAWQSVDDSQEYNEQKGPTIKTESNNETDQHGKIERERERERGTETEKWFLILGSRDRASSQKILIIPELCSPTKITRLLLFFFFFLFWSSLSSFVFCCCSLFVPHSFVLYSLRFGFVRLRFHSISFVAVFFSFLSLFFSTFRFLHCRLLSVHFLHTIHTYMFISQQTVTLCSSSISL